MRISDWSSDVCSSDLPAPSGRPISRPSSAAAQRHNICQGTIMRVVSGIQPTGNLHLGNYLGAIKQWVAMQDDVAAAGGDCLFFLADLHALTVAIDPKELAANTIEMAAALLAAGIDPEKAIQIGRAQSELQSLMRTQYAVFCLQKKTIKTK